MVSSSILHILVHSVITPVPLFPDCLHPHYLTPVTLSVCGKAKDTTSGRSVNGSFIAKSLHLPGHPVTAAVLRDVITEPFCSLAHYGVL
jgi:hypothetical protein